MVNFFQYILIRALFWLIFWLLLYPISWTLLTPVILIGAAFTRDPYWESVKNGYRNVTEFWSRNF
jgi:hypothetical protein